jgi:fido (protein-threonine AMPylation protein)
MFTRVWWIRCFVGGIEYRGCVTTTSSPNRTNRLGSLSPDPAALKQTVDHKTCIQVLAWLAKNSNQLSQTFAASAFEELVLLLKYLATVSPVKESDSPIRSLALGALEHLRDHGFLTAERDDPPWFGPGKCVSPVASNLLEFKHRLSHMFTNHPRRDFLLKYVEDNPPPKLMMLIDMRVGEVFTTIGTHDGAIEPNRGGGGGPGRGFGGSGGMYGRRPVGQQKSESARVAEICTSLLRASGAEPLFTVANLRKVHSTLNLDFANASGVLRTEVAVGSHRFFASYRVFAPAQEIEQLLGVLETEMNTEALAWHPAQQAFYVFGALVWFIHPFLDGNGRAARLFGNLFLKKYGLRAVIKSTDKVVRFEDFLNLLVERIESTQQANRQL